MSEQVPGNAPAREWYVLTNGDTYFAGPDGEVYALMNAKPYFTPDQAALELAQQLPVLMGYYVARVYAEVKPVIGI